MIKSFKPALDNHELTELLQELQKREIRSVERQLAFADELIKLKETIIDLQNVIVSMEVQSGGKV